MTNIRYITVYFDILRTHFEKCLSTFTFKVKVNKNNYTLTFSGHVGVGDPGLNESFTQSMSESIERHQLQNIAGTMQKFSVLS